MRFTNSVADRAAIGVSMLCLIHCLLLPVAIALLPAAAGWLDVPERFHLLAIAVAVPISGIAIVAGYRRHGFAVPGLMALIGLALIALGAVAGFRSVVETIVTVLGGLILAFGHLYNWKAASATSANAPVGFKNP